MKQNENQAKLSEGPYIKCSPDPQTYYRSGKNPLIRGSKASHSQGLAWHDLSFQEMQIMGIFFQWHRPLCGLH